jgi:hypothetical protein
MDASTLTGQHVRLYPYLRGEFPRGTFYALWRAVDAEGAIDKLFYAQPVNPAPFSMRGDLSEFVRYFDDPKRLLFIAQSLKTDDLAGLVWFDEMQAGHRAAVNVFYRRRMWGAPAREGTRLACRFMFEAHGLAAIWGFTPWMAAVTHGLAIGFHRLTTLPEFVVIDGTPRDLHILRARSKELRDG